MKKASFRAAVMIAALVVACSSAEDEDEGCGGNIGERACSSDDDCEGFTPLDIAVLGPRVNAVCFRTRCESGTCEATPVPGRVPDETRGDCQRPVCDDDGRLRQEPDRSDVRRTEQLEPCRKNVCERGLLGGLVSTTTSSPDGAWCTVDGESGTCSAGACVLDERPDASDAGSDADEASDASETSDATTD